MATTDAKAFINTNVLIRARFAQYPEHNEAKTLIETSAVTRRLLELLKKYPTGGRQVHDANIVATLLVNQINTLVTINVEDMQRFGPEITLISLKKSV